MSHVDAREGKWRGYWRMEWVASTLHTASEHGVASITTADGYTSAASSRLNRLSRPFKWTRPFRRKKKSGFWACHHISNAVYNLCYKTWQPGQRIWYSEGATGWVTQGSKPEQVTKVYPVSKMSRPALWVTKPPTRVFRLPPRSSWELGSSGLLRSE